MQQQNLGFTAEMSVLQGVVDSIVFTSNDGGFSVFRLRMEQQGRCNAEQRISSGRAGCTT